MAPVGQRGLSLAKTRLFSTRRMLAAFAVLPLVLFGNATTGGSLTFPREAPAGHTVVVAGRGWAECCAPDQPTSRVLLYLRAHDDWVELLDSPVDAKGEVRASFSVPSVEPGQYLLRVCVARGTEPSVVCRSEGHFTVLRTSVPAPTSNPAATGADAGMSDRDRIVIAAVIVNGLAIASLLAYTALHRRRGGEMHEPSGRALEIGGCAQEPITSHVGVFPPDRTGPVESQPFLQGSPGWATMASRGPHSRRAACLVGIAASRNPPNGRAAAPLPWMARQFGQRRIVERSSVGHS